MSADRYEGEAVLATGAQGFVGSLGEELGWHPSRDLDEGLAAAWEWYRARLAG